MDLPWNPAILEQRIGRVHRLGQKRAVQVINFVARGTIEESMLSVLRFKKSLFAGVLDGGEKEIMFGGSRLTKFMESVEQTTQAIPSTQTGHDNTESMSERTTGKKSLVPSTPPGVTTDPWAGLVQTGLAFLQNLSAVANASSAGNGKTNPLVEGNAKTGEQFLKLPMPNPETLQQLMTMLSTLLPK